MFKKFSAIFDVHGVHAHANTIRLFCKHLKDFKPHYRIIGGDLFDCASLRGKASAEEKSQSLLDDFGAGMKVFEDVRPTHYLVGNHERRLFDGTSSVNGPIRDLASILVADVRRSARSHGCRVLPYCKRSGVLTLPGGLRFLHGFYAGEGACKKHAQIYGPCIFGHIHAYDHVSLPSYEGNREAWSSPAACQLDMDYNSATPSTLRYSNGWVYGVIGNGTYHVEVAVVENGKAIVASDLKVLG